MPYTDTTTFLLGGRTLAAPRARITKTDSSVVAVGVSAGWRVMAGNVYEFTYAYPDGFRGSVEVYDDTTAVGVAAAINPPALTAADIENLVVSGMDNIGLDGTTVTEIKTAAATLEGMTEADGPVRQYTANALELTPAGGGGGGGGLVGASSVTINFRDGAGASIGPIRFTVVGQGSGMSNAEGVAAFGIDNGTYVVVAAQKNGVLFPSTALAVSGTTTLTITGAVPAIDPPISPDQSTGFLICYDASGLPAVGKIISFTMVRGRGSDGRSFGTQMTATSGSLGLLQASFVRGAIYEAMRGTSGKSVRFEVPLTGTSFPIPETLGRD